LVRLPNSSRPKWVSKSRSSTSAAGVGIRI
jgi:hypothetical protein